MNIRNFCFLLLLFYVFYMGIKWWEDTTLNNQLKSQLEQAIPGVQNLVIQSGSYSRIYNKKHIFLKLRKPDMSFYDTHTLKYVLIHEIAHIISDNYDTGDHIHSKEFYRIFDKLIQKSTKANVYNPNLRVDPDY